MHKQPKKLEFHQHTNLQTNTKLGQVRKRQYTRQVGIGQDLNGQVGTGSSGMGRDRLGLSSWAWLRRARTGQNGSEGVGMDWNGLGRISTGQDGSGRVRTSQDRKGQVRSGEVRSVTITTTRKQNQNIKF